MKTLIISLIFSLFLGFSYTQDDDFKAPRFMKQPIENTGCYAYFPQ